MPRAPWRRRTNDSPGPAGRRWTGRLRRGGTLARRALLTRVGRRRSAGQPITVGEDRSRRAGRAARQAIAPVSPAPYGAGAIAGTAGALPGQPGDATIPHTIPLLPGVPSVDRRLKFALANSFTVGSLMLGMSAIFLAMHGEVRIAAISLLGCVIFDGMDGAVARKLGVASPFGAQMDSLADMCSFGMAAPVVVYATLHGHAPTPLIAVSCGMIAAGAAIRLARFNVSPKDGRYFCGVPTTMTAAVMGLAVLIELDLPGFVAVASVAVLALAMVSGFPYAKLSRVARLPAWFWVAPLVGFYFDYRVTFSVLVAVYLVSGPLIWLRQRAQRSALA